MAEVGREKDREIMVARQLVGRDITDPRVLEAMRSIPRHVFVPPEHQHMAYDDMAMAIGLGQTISQPYMVAKMTEMLELTGNERVLEIGTGSGYQSSVLAHLAREVFTIERIPALATQARQSLDILEIHNIAISVRDGTQGWTEAAPFDRILITAATPEIPSPLEQQLAEGGILVAPIGSRTSQQLVKLTKRNGKISRDYGIFCVFVPLIGEHGFSS